MNNNNFTFVHNVATVAKMNNGNIQINVSFAS